MFLYNLHVVVFPDIAAGIFLTSCYILASCLQCSPKMNLKLPVSCQFVIPVTIVTMVKWRLYTVNQNVTIL